MHELRLEISSTKKHKEKSVFQSPDTRNLGNKWEKLEILVDENNVLWMESVKPVGVTHMIAILKSQAVSITEEHGTDRGHNRWNFYDRCHLLWNY